MKLDRADKLNVVPLIDVMLVLLVIVLTAASFITYGKVEVNLPKTSNSSDEFPKERLEIVLFENNTIKFKDEFVNIDDLKFELSQISKEEFILFKGDKKAEFGVFVDILQILKELNLSNFMIMTEKNER
ncbi:MAG: biopolymer transporter ExbD [Campylobacter sp.]|nr:biopolymer transporter ExbD [Campylobacter sp.]